MKLPPHPEELAKQALQEEINGKTIEHEDKYGVVSSSTESSPVKQEFGNAFTSPVETKDEGGYMEDYRPL